jgi:MoxR-like ATPase
MPAKPAAKSSPAPDLQRPPSEVLYADELNQLSERDAKQPKPDGWRMSPRSVISFVLGDEKLGCSAKFVGGRAMLERCVVALATNRGLMLIGEPGTAKSYLSELLAAAVCGDSTLTIQGSAGTTEDAIKYSWNYALLLAEGPSLNSLVPAPLYRGMTGGQIVRFEEITRCPLEMQDTMLSILSDRVMAIPELKGADRSLFARNGFNVIATANTRDRGVNEMSAALKRRFNFETIPAIADLKHEMALVQRETDRMLAHAKIPMKLMPDVAEIIVTVFRELRNGKTSDGKALETLTSPMSTAEAVSTAYAANVHAWFCGEGKVTAEHLAQHVAGSALKESPDDRKRLQHYFKNALKERNGGLWQAFADAGRNV